MQTREVLENYLAEAIHYYNNDLILDAYLKYQTAQQLAIQENKTVYHLFAELGLFDCQLTLGTIDLTTAAEEFSKLKKAISNLPSNHSLNHDFPIELANLEKKMTVISTSLTTQTANFYFSFANLLALTLSEEERISNTDFDQEEGVDNDTFELSKKLLGLSENDFPNRREALKKGIESIALASDIYRTIKLRRHFDQAEWLHAELCERLADAYFDEACNLTDDQLSDSYFNLAIENYKNAINIKERLLENKSYYDRQTKNYKEEYPDLIALYFSVLQAFQKAAKRNTHNGKIYIDSISQFIVEKELQLKISYLARDERKNYKEILKKHESFCMTFSKQLKSPKRKKNHQIDNQDDGQLSQNQHTSKPVTQKATEVLEPSVENTEAQNLVSNTAKETAKMDLATPKITAISQFFFQQPSTEPGVNLKKENAKAKDIFLMLFNKLLRAIDSKLNGPHLSQFLREIARAHRIQIAKDASHVTLAKTLYEKALGLYPKNIKAKNELDFLKKHYGMLLNQESKDSITTYHAMCQRIGHKTFFNEALTQYLATLESKFPQHFQSFLKNLLSEFNSEKFIHLFPTNEYFSMQQKMQMQSFLIDGLNIINKKSSSNALRNKH